MKYNDNELIQMIRTFKKRTGNVPRCIDCTPGNQLPTYTTFAKRFGSFNNAIITAGFLPRENIHNRAYTRDKLLQALKCLSQKLGRTPFWNELGQNGLPQGLNTWKRHFKSYSEACKEIGLLPRNPHGPRLYSDEEIISCLHKLRSDLGRTPTQSDLRKRKEFPNPSTLIFRFGSWKNALSRAGIKPTLKEHIRFSITKIATGLLRISRRML